MLKSSIQRVFRNIGWLTGHQFVQMVISFAVGVVVARILGPEVFGRYSKGIAYVAIMAPFAGLGTRGIVVRDIAAATSTDRVSELLGTTLVLRAAGSLAATTVSLAIAWISGEDPSFLAFLLVVAFGTFLPNLDVPRLYFEARTESKYYVIPNTIGSVTSAAAKLAAALLLPALILLAAASVAGAAVFVLSLYMVFLRRREEGTTFRTSKRVAAELVKQGLPLAASSFAIMVQARVDQLMLGWLLGNEPLGQYSVAVRLIEVFAFVPMVVQVSVLPGLSRAYETDDTLFAARMRNFYRGLTIAFVLVAIPVVTIGPGAVRLVFGEEYGTAGRWFVMYALRLLFHSFAVGRSAFILNTRVYSLTLISTVAGAVVNILLNLLLIPGLSGVGAILATYGSFLTSIVLVDLFHPVGRRNIRLMFEGLISPHRFSVR